MDCPLCGDFYRGLSPIITPACPCGAIKMEAEKTQEKSALAGRRRRIFLGPMHERAGRKVPIPAIDKPIWLAQKQSL
jgi:hypothetical protein